METHMLLTNLTLGLILGVAGQILRSVAGLRKAAGGVALPAQSAPAPVQVPGSTPALRGQPASVETFSWTQFGVSLILGGVAGMVASLTLWDRMSSPNKDTVMGLIAAGYAGSDFLDGVINWLPRPAN